ncbi:MAG: phosphatase PAP2 family protein [Spirochaetia bacterium]|nr:phosphatase PAP2 family protein [Spirochaetia bacterium]
MLDILNNFDKALFEFILVYLNFDFIVQTAGFIVNEKNFFMPIAILYIFYLFANYKRALIFLILFLLLLLISESLAAFLKEFFMRERPSAQMGRILKASNYSFPSAHALNTMALALFCGYWFSSKKKMFFYISIVVGIARVLSNHHFPFDVIFGWICGYTLGYIYIQILENIAEYKVNQKLNQSP